MAIRLNPPDYQTLNPYNEFDDETKQILTSLEGVFKSYSYFDQMELNDIYDKFQMFRRGFVCNGFEHSNPSHDAAIQEVIAMFEDFSVDMGEKLRRLAYRYAKMKKMETYALIIYFFTILAVTPTLNLCATKWEHEQHRIDVDSFQISTTWQ